MVPFDDSTVNALLSEDPWSESFEVDTSSALQEPSLESLLSKEAPSLVNGPFSPLDARYFKRFYNKVVEGKPTCYLRSEFHGTSLEGFTLDHKMWKWTDRTRTLSDFVSGRIEGRFDVVMRTGDVATRERYVALVDSLVAANSRAVQKITRARYRIAHQKIVLHDLNAIQDRLNTLKDKVHVVYDLKHLDVKLKTGRVLPYWETKRYEQTVCAEVVSWATQMQKERNPVDYAFQKLQDACVSAAHLPDEGMKSVRALYNSAFEHYIKTPGLLEVAPIIRKRPVVAKTVPAAKRPYRFTKGDGVIDEGRCRAPYQMPGYVSPPEDPRYARQTLRRMNRGLDTGVCTMPGKHRNDLKLPPLPDADQRRWYSSSVIKRDSSPVVTYQPPQQQTRRQSFFNRVISALSFVLR